MYSQCGVTPTETKNLKYKNILQVLCVQVKGFSALIQQGKLAWNLVHRLINFLQQELNSSFSR